jgi:hypothetical protein
MRRNLQALPPMPILTGLSLSLNEFSQEIFGAVIWLYRPVGDASTRGLNGVAFGAGVFLCNFWDRGSEYLLCTHGIYALSYQSLSDQMISCCSY